MAQLQLKNIVKHYGKTPVIHGVNLEINSGEFIVFVGPSGCGKSTLLRMVAGLEDITDGEMSIDDEVVNDVCRPNVASPWCFSPMRSIPICLFLKIWPLVCGKPKPRKTRLFGA